MTVTDRTPSITYIYTSSPVEYNFPFKIMEIEDLEVYLTLHDGSIIPLQLSTHYSVTLINEGNDGGIVIVHNGGDDPGYITIERHMPREQQTNWVNNDPFSTEQLEDDLDRIVMMLQEFGYNLDKMSVFIGWRGEWLPHTHYKMRSMVSSPDNDNIYICTSEHTSSDNFDDDVAAGRWALMIPLGDAGEAADRAEQARDEAIDAANDAENYAEGALQQALLAAQAAANAAQAETNAANCATEAHETVSGANESAVEAYHWAQYPEDIPVPESDNPPEYSAFHWAKKAEGLAQGGIEEVTGTPPVIVTPSGLNRNISLDESDSIFVPPPGSDDDILKLVAGVPSWDSQYLKSLGSPFGLDVDKTDKNWPHLSVQTEILHRPNLVRNPTFQLNTYTDTIFTTYACNGWRKASGDTNYSSIITNTESFIQLVATLDTQSILAIRQGFEFEQFFLNDIFTLSFDIKVSMIPSDMNLNAHAEFRASDAITNNANHIEFIDNPHIPITVDVWNRVSYTFQIDQDFSTKNMFYLTIGVTRDDGVASIFEADIKNVKLEQGNFATPFIRPHITEQRNISLAYHVPIREEFAFQTRMINTDLYNNVVILPTRMIRIPDYSVTDYVDNENGDFVMIQNLKPQGYQGIVSTIAAPMGSSAYYRIELHADYE